MVSPRTKRIDINVDRKQIFNDCTASLGKNAAQRAAAQRGTEMRERERDKDKEERMYMRLAGERHRRVYSSAAGRHVGTSERGGSERNGQRPPPVITDVNYVRTRTSAAGRYVYHG